MVNIGNLGRNVILPFLLLIQKSSKHKKKKQKKEKDEKEKKKKKRHHHHHTEGDGRDSVQNGTVEEEEPLPVSLFPTCLYTTVCEKCRVVQFLWGAVRVLYWSDTTPV